MFNFYLSKNILVIIIPTTLFIFFTLYKRYIGIIICLLLISYFPYGAWWNDFANTFLKIIMHPKSILLVSYESIWTIVQIWIYLNYRSLHKWLRADNEACNTGFSKQPAWLCNAFLFLQWFFRNFVSVLTTQTFRISSFNLPAWTPISVPNSSLFFCFTFQLWFQRKHMWFAYWFQVIWL